jgi:hypothetical protein
VLLPKGGGRGEGTCTLREEDAAVGVATFEDDKAMGPAVSLGGLLIFFFPATLDVEGCSDNAREPSDMGAFCFVCARVEEALWIIGGVEGNSGGSRRRGGIQSK